MEAAGLAAAAAAAAAGAGLEEGLPRKKELKGILAVAGVAFVAGAVDAAAAAGAAVEQEREKSQSPRSAAGPDERSLSTHQASSWLLQAFGPLQQEPSLAIRLRRGHL